MSHRSWRLPVGASALVALLALMGLFGDAWSGSGGSDEAAAAGPVDGSAAECDPWLRLAIGDNDWEVAEEGWVWVNGEGTADKFREVSGVATKSKVAHNDLPENHFSHDWNVDIRVDPGQVQTIGAVERHAVDLGAAGDEHLFLPRRPRQLEGAIQRPGDDHSGRR